jgi:hypothetical protein
VLWSPKEDIMMLWIVGALLVAALVAGGIWLRKKQRQAADERLARARENYLAKRRALVAGVRINARGPSLVSLEGTVVQVIDEDQVIARMRREDSPTALFEEGPFPIKYINEVDGKWYGWD